MFLNYNFVQEEVLNYKELESIEVPTKQELKYIIDYEIKNSNNDESLLNRVAIYLDVKRNKSNSHKGKPSISSNAYGECSFYER